MLDTEAHDVWNYNGSNTFEKDVPEGVYKVVS